MLGTLFNIPLESGRSLSSISVSSRDVFVKTVSEGSKGFVGPWGRESWSRCAAKGWLTRRRLLEALYHALAPRQAIDWGPSKLGCQPVRFLELPTRLIHTHPHTYYQCSLVQESPTPPTAETRVKTQGVTVDHDVPGRGVLEKSCRKPLSLGLLALTWLKVPRSSKA